MESTLLNLRKRRFLPPAGGFAGMTCDKMLDIQKNIILSKYTTFQIGGAAKEFVVVKNKEELIEAISHAKEKNEEFVVLGGGSNVLINDKGFNGLVIKLHIAGYKLHDNIIECEAGMMLSELINLAAENKLSGLEWAMGVPGTLGGAIRGNAGAYGSNISSIVETVEVFEINNNQISNFKSQDCDFSYRNSVFKKDKNLIIISAKLKFEKKNKDEIIAKMKETNEKRVKRIPQGWKGSAGSFFENPTVENQDLIAEFEKETGVKVSDKKIPAGWLIERAGLSGKKIGDVVVSETNCNFILNTGNGTAEQVIILSSLIKQKVRGEFGVQLKEEVRMIGF